MHQILCLLPRFDNPQDVSDKPQTIDVYKRQLMSSSGNSRNGAHSSNRTQTGGSGHPQRKPLTKAQKAAIRKKKRQKKIILVVDVYKRQRC